MSEANCPWKSWREDPAVRRALKERLPADVCLIDCPGCGSQIYYNQGSHADCHVCGRVTRDEYILEGCYTVADVIDGQDLGDGGE